MYTFFKSLIPISWRNQFRRISRDTAETDVQNQRLTTLEKQLADLSGHVNNITDLTVSTTQNLESVGVVLKDIGAKVENSLSFNESNLQSMQDSLNLTREQLWGFKQGQDSIIKELTALSQENSRNRLCNILLFQNLPLEYPITSDTRKRIEEFKTSFHINFPFYDGINRDDIMFLTSLLHIGDYPLSYHSYLSTGLNGFNLIQRILRSARDHVEVKGNILDFAGGYGRVTRFLAGYYKPEQVYTSDIKPAAVDYQMNKMGVKGFYSDYDPFKLKVDERFEVIFVGSLFSHLNKELYKNWLIQLLAMTESTGLLIFSVHDISLYPNETTEDHIYVEDNEDTPFLFVENKITSKDKYGVSFASEKFISELISSINPDAKYVRYPKGFGGLQDVYVVTKGGALPKVDLDLSVYP